MAHELVPVRRPKVILCSRALVKPESKQHPVLEGILAANGRSAVHSALNGRTVIEVARGCRDASLVMVECPGRRYEDDYPLYDMLRDWVIARFTSPAVLLIDRVHANAWTDNNAAFYEWFDAREDGVQGPRPPAYVYSHSDGPMEAARLARASGWIPVMTDQGSIRRDAESVARFFIGGA